MKHYCFFHKSDLDGHCSGAIFRMVAEISGWDYELVPYQYGDKIDCEKYKGADVYFLDCSPQPLSEYGPKLKEVVNRIIVCDHHKTAIEDPYFKEYCYLGNSRLGAAGCFLAWESWSHILGEMPIAVILLSDYDCWHNSDKQRWEHLLLPFQYGCRSYETCPTLEESRRFWDSIIGNGNRPEMLVKIMERGIVLLEAEIKRNTFMAKSSSFPASFEGLRAICMNAPGNSQLFDSVYNKEQFDIMLKFQIFPKDGRLLYGVSLYSDKTEIDCGKIAKWFGGGGHPGAAGFQAESLNLENGILEVLRCRTTNSSPDA